MQRGVNSHLTRLLLRLDYNGYLSGMSDRIEQEKNAKLIADYHQNVSLKGLR